MFWNLGWTISAEFWVEWEMVFKATVHGWESLLVFLCSVEESLFIFRNGCHLPCQLFALCTLCLHLASLASMFLLVILSLPPEEKDHTEEWSGTVTVTFCFSLKASCKDSVLASTQTQEVRDSLSFYPSEPCRLQALCWWWYWGQLHTSVSVNTGWIKHHTFLFSKCVK